MILLTFKMWFLLLPFYFPLFYMILFPGTSHPKLATAIAKKYKYKIGASEIKKFSAGETYVKLAENVRGQDCTILQTITQNVNDDYMEIFLLADALRRHDAAEVNLILPHLGYARQDRRAVMGEPISAKLLGDLLGAAGIHRMVTFDLHSDQIEGFFDFPVDNLHCSPLFADYFKRKNLKDPVIVAPDASAAKRARRLSILLKCPIAILNKFRPAHHKTEFTHVIGEVKGKSAILYDDMIDTGSTISPACETLLSEGAREVYIAVTHGVFSGPAYERLLQAKCKEIVVTDTLPLDKSQLGNLKVLSIVPLLEKVL